MKFVKYAWLLSFDIPRKKIKNKFQIHLKFKIIFMDLFTINFVLIAF